MAVWGSGEEVLAMGYADSTHSHRHLRSDAALVWTLDPRPGGWGGWVSGRKRSLTHPSIALSLSGVGWVYMAVWGSGEEVMAMGYAI
jgi:hypothetical protein